MQVEQAILEYNHASFEYYLPGITERIGDPISPTVVVGCRPR